MSQTTPNAEPCPIVDARLRWDATASGGILPDECLGTAGPFRMDGVVWYASEASDALHGCSERIETDTRPIPFAMVAPLALVDADTEAQLAAYAGRRHLTTVHARLHGIPDISEHPAVHDGLTRVHDGGFRCVIDVASTQLQEVLGLARAHPALRIAIARMGSPCAVDTAGFARWWSNMKALSACENVDVEIAGIAAIFGDAWDARKIAPWVLSTVEMFGPGRCMLGSDLSSGALADEGGTIYDGYRSLLGAFTADDQDRMFRRNAVVWFRVR